MSKTTVLQKIECSLVILLFCILSYAVLFVGEQAGSSIVKNLDRQVTLERIPRMDEANYLKIAQDDYYYRKSNRSNVAFFPLFPICSRIISVGLGFSAHLSLVIVANLFACATLVVVFFVTLSDSSCESGFKCQWAIALFLLMPSAFFFRFAYAESMLCFFIALALLGMQRRWPIWLLTLFAGLASGTRPVGIALSAAVWWYVLFSNAPSVLSPVPEEKRGLRLVRYVSIFWVIPLSCTGLLAYMAYLWYHFDAPFAFAQTQQHWTFLAPTNYTIWDKVWSLMTLEPIWNVYNPNSQRYWMNGELSSNPLFSCQFWNPIFYLLAWFLIGLGWYKKWLKDYEIVLSVGLLLIPYVTRAYEMSMASHARFAAVVIPQYFVLGRLFAMMPPAIAGCLCGLMGLMMGLWTALFVAGYRFF